MSSSALAPEPVAQQPGTPRALDQAIRALPKAWFVPNPAIYWTDLLLSAGSGWLAFILAATRSGWSRAGFLIAAVALLYRAVLFIHEITHLAARDVPLFTLAWNALVGVPLLIPSFLYQGVHTDHHRQRCYATELDPEYVPYARRSPLLIATSVIAALFVPVAFVLRFGLLAPAGWLVPAWRRAIDARASALVINHRYIRRAPVGAGGRAQEVAASVVTWTVAILWWRNQFPTRYLWTWLLVGGVVSLVNALRTLAAHRYDSDSGSLSMTEQLLDSCTIAPTSTLNRRLLRLTSSVAHAAVAPVGLRYHALHHWIPSLPYHNLGRAHRRLLVSLQPDAPYRSTEEPTLASAIARLLRRSFAARTRG